MCPHFPVFTKSSSPFTLFLILIYTFFCFLKKKNPVIPNFYFIFFHFSFSFFQFISSFHSIRFPFLLPSPIIHFFLPFHPIPFLSPFSQALTPSLFFFLPHFHIEQILPPLFSNHFIFPPSHPFLPLTFPNYLVRSL